jgi:RNA-directed DNA polymerase
MMNGLEKSDSAVVAAKPANKAGHPVAEWVEPRAGTKGNAGRSHTRRTQRRGSVSQGLDRVRQVAKQSKKERFTALLHHVTVELLRESFLALKRHAAPGADGVQWRDYEAGLESNLQDLHRRVQHGTYRALPVVQRFIAKPDGKQRPLGITALEDKLVQRAVVTVLSSIYEGDFLGFSYGFRPERSQHDALDALVVGISSKRVNWILDADIRSFFDKIDPTWLIKMLEHRIGDGRVIRLVRRWLKAGVLDEGVWSVSEAGTPQGAVISPLLANVFLHYVFDLWAQQWRRREANGEMIVVRYADDIVTGFEHEADEKAFWEAMRERFERFALELHGEKTRLLEFGRRAADRRRQVGLGKPETFNFLGFTFICGKSVRGGFLLLRKTRRDRMRVRL